MTNEVEYTFFCYFVKRDIALYWFDLKNIYRLTELSDYCCWLLTVLLDEYSSSNNAINLIISKYNKKFINYTSFFIKNSNLNKINSFAKYIKNFTTVIIGIYNLLKSTSLYIMKKYLYTINHKKLGLMYIYFTTITAIAGSYLATNIRIEMAYPGSPLFDGNSLKYLQVISAHALIMIFFVVVPIFFGGFANFLIPYHVGSKDVAYPRLNNMGFWIQPCGFLLILKMSAMHVEYWYPETRLGYLTKYNKNIIDIYYQNEISAKVQNNVLWGDFYNDIELLLEDKKKIMDILNNIKNKINFNLNTMLSYKLLVWDEINNNIDSLWFLVKNVFKLKRKKRFIVKCTNATQTVSGWTFITPFSSNVEFTGLGLQDMLILGVYFVGISTTISIVNLLVTRRILSISGLRNRRILIPFISTTLLLMLRALSVITPVLGSAMLMLLFDRHFSTSFFDFAYGGDPIFFQHLFWFFGHPEVYVLIIPAFGIINSVLPSTNTRRIASKHHLIWAIYVMNYMGFIVWGHHMYLIGLDHRSRALYSTITIMISLPATIKVVNWTFTLINGALKNDLIIYAIISFIFFFLVAGFTGMWLSHVSLNISMHDTLYVVAHFHLMLSGAVLMGIFVGFYAYFYSLFELKYAKLYAYAHIFYYSIGQWLTFIPLFWLAFSGLPRRIHDFPYIYIGWQAAATNGHFITMLGVTFFYTTMIESLIEKKTPTSLNNIFCRLNNYCLYLLFKITFLKTYLKKTNIIFTNLLKYKSILNKNFII